MFEHPVFGERFREELDRLFHWRRDVRRFERRPLPEDSLPSLIERACCAPSVGLSQPWRFVRVREYERRAKVRAIFEHCNAEALARQSADRASLYARLKLSGLDEAPEHVAVFVDADPATGAGLGRATMPETLAYSAVLAIHTLWLAAAAEGIGVGWVSILDPEAVASALEVPAGWRLVGYLCIGYPSEHSEVPELERAGWEHRLPVREFVLER
ncbi:5,6-dimethylbenzimidazole synthase [Starkeya sp. ORNL1]|uniref:5,6-dimethylbenzimidazole synthase n=1 Tax=Starkeya sp. ORNL1 TaxID=2709380 RepID=UPI001463A928|nr:5,6-dimethylbenzimidazole synthase [Starkeya sp. ORNL1]QJP13778.1 5,6-dimethylbenzimidazole synthase [Starkeya sp. ORNL1]